MTLQALLTLSTIQVLTKRCQTKKTQARYGIRMLDNRGLCVLGSKTSMASVSIEEKRLKALKQQLFGKEQPVYDHKAKLSPKDLNFKSGKSAESSPAVTALSLKKDLTKIAILSVSALLIQFALFFASRNGIFHFV
jgi:hypothetical protein